MLASDVAVELADAEEKERELQTALIDAEAAVLHSTDSVTSSAKQLQDAERAASRAEQELIETRARADSATRKRDELRAGAERALGDLEACQRQTTGMDVEAAGIALEKARQALADLPSVPDVTPEARAHADREPGETEA